jgi:hypothetical protein
MRLCDRRTICPKDSPSSRLPTGLDDVLLLYQAIGNRFVDRIGASSRKDVLQLWWGWLVG